MSNVIKWRATCMKCQHVLCESESMTETGETAKQLKVCPNCGCKFDSK